jgi:hypothetical protein
MRALPSENTPSTYSGELPIEDAPAFLGAIMAQLATGQFEKNG